MRSAENRFEPAGVEKSRVESDGDFQFEQFAR